ncbi:hypothetical protein O181_099798 [Austropuccinia psidii MF-1]|uniref:Uncharacterized protein n=1 Tax=Austropuccinia psidii MF-1 TaxID=1389203 RepID=A0A9Q3JDE6_9BASI|nr:hypothetical protein [Austropuccinia psidii MF-1]
MSSKLTELTESSTSVPPPSVLCGSGILSQFSSPSMASFGHFDPTQTYYGYKAVEVLILLVLNVWKWGRIVLKITIPALPNATSALLGRNHVFILGSKLKTSGGICGRDVTRCTNVGGPIPVGGRPIYSSSEVPISRINTEGIVKQIRKIVDSPPDPYAEGSDELDGEEVEVAPNSSGNPSNTSPAKRFQSHIIPSTPRNFQPTVATIPTSIPPESPNSSHTRPSLNPEVRQSPIQQPRNSPIFTSQQLQPVASTSRRREEHSPFPFPAAQVFQRRDFWPI